MEKTRVSKCERYWSIRIFAGVIETFNPMELGQSDDNISFESGNYFHTKEEAEVMADKLRAVLKGADVIEKSKYEDELNVATEIFHQKGYSDGEYCHEQSFSWGFQEGVDWLKSKIVK